MLKSISAEVEKTVAMIRGYMGIPKKKKERWGWVQDVVHEIFWSNYI